MAERFAVYRYGILRDGEAPETRYSLAPMQGVGYAGNDEPSDAHPRGNEHADVGRSVPAGHVEAPDGTTISAFEPPTLEIPGRGRVDLSAVIGATAGGTGELGALVRWMPAG